jgi:hypothetical protein
MRTLRLSLMGTVILALLGGLSGAVLAQSEEEEQSGTFTPAIVGNAHKVDGKHAVAAWASIAQRARKLVATNAQGKLPNNIINRAPNANLLDGLDSTLFAQVARLRSGVGSVNQSDNYVHWNQLLGVPSGFADGRDQGYGSFITSPTNNSISANGSLWIYVTLPRSWEPQIQIVPNFANRWFEEKEQWVQRLADGRLQHAFLIENHSAINTSFKVRVLYFFDGIAAASSKQAIKVTASKKGPRSK